MEGRNLWRSVIVLSALWVLPCESTLAPPSCPGFDPTMLKHRFLGVRNMSTDFCKDYQLAQKAGPEFLAELCTTAISPYFYEVSNDTSEEMSIFIQLAVAKGLNEVDIGTILNNIKEYCWSMKTALPLLAAMEKGKVNVKTYARGDYFLVYQDWENCDSRHKIQLATCALDFNQENYHRRQNILRVVDEQLKDVTESQIYCDCRNIFSSTELVGVNLIAGSGDGKLAHIIKKICLEKPEGPLGFHNPVWTDKQLALIKESDSLAKYNEGEKMEFLTKGGPIARSGWGDVMGPDNKPIWTFDDIAGIVMDVNPVKPEGNKILVESAAKCVACLIETEVDYQAFSITKEKLRVVLTRNELTTSCSLNRLHHEMMTLIYCQKDTVVPKSWPSAKKVNYFIAIVAAWDKENPTSCSALPTLYKDLMQAFRRSHWDVDTLHRFLVHGHSLQKDATNILTCLTLLMRMEEEIGVHKMEEVWKGYNPNSPGLDDFRMALLKAPRDQCQNGFSESVYKPHWETFTKLMKTIST